MLQTAYRPSWMNRASVFEWYKRFKEGREFVKDDERFGRSKKVRTPELIGQIIHAQVFDDPFFDSTGMIYMHWVPTGQTVNKEYYVEVLREFRKRLRRKRPAIFKSGPWHFHQDNAPVHNSILVTDYVTKIGINIVPHPSYSPDVSSCDFCLFPKLRGCRYETIEKMKEAVTKLIDMII